MLTILDMSRQTGIKQVTVRQRLVSQNVKPISKQGKKNLYKDSDLKKVTHPKKKPRPMKLSDQEKIKYKIASDRSMVLFQYLTATDIRHASIASDLKLKKEYVREIIHDYLDQKEKEPKEQFIILESKMNNNPNL